MLRWLLSYILGWWQNFCWAEIWSRSSQTSWRCWRKQYLLKKTLSALVTIEGRRLKPSYNEREKLAEYYVPLWWHLWAMVSKMTGQSRRFHVDTEVSAAWSVKTTFDDGLDWLDGTPLHTSQEAGLTQERTDWASAIPKMWWTRDNDYT